jgi:UDP-N-acetylglucosamine--N-acetylmuramyl-(pentapeptide) pyrophosphoryl-undecaprenol N-acetylglucosamine transferase
VSTLDLQATRDRDARLTLQLAQRLDLGLAVSVLALLGLGLVMVSSASVGIADRDLGDPLYFLRRQGVFVLLGLLVAALVYQVRLAHWEGTGAWLLAFVYFLLVLVLVPGVGKTVNGSTRWLSLGLFNLQVSELAKLFVTVYMAGYLVRHGPQIRESLVGFLRPIVLLAVAAVLLLLEPDFGAAAVLMAIGLGMLFLGGAKIWQFALLAGAVGAALSALAWSSPYRVLRLTSFLDPWTDPYNSGFQLTQSLIAIGSGSWFGVGLGASVQKLFYLPEGPQRLPVCGPGRRARARGDHHGRGPLCVSGLALLSHRALGGAGRPALRRLSGLRNRHVAGAPGLHQHGRQHGPPADQGAHPAADELWGQLHAGELRRRRPAVACPQGDRGARCASPPGLSDRESAVTDARTVLIMAGGTGGHVFPGLAVAERLRALGENVLWLGTAKGLESRLVPAAGFPFFTLPVSGLRGKGPTAWLLAPWRLGIALWGALGLLTRLKPSVVLGLGGFASGPGGLMAAALGRPLVIHEQNAIAGMTNRWLARVADVVLEAFPGTFPARRQAVHVGNPVREAITRIAPPVERFAGRTGRLRLLVLGGSLGALALNESVPEALKRLPEGERPEVWHQSGARTLQEALLAYRSAGVQGRVQPFIEDMAEAYAWADLVLCRAGALTVSELAAVGLGSILVPYPHAVDDHQRANARYLVDARAAVLVPQSRLGTTALVELLSALHRDRERVAAMAKAARELARPRATEQVVEACLALARGNAP